MHRAEIGKTFSDTTFATINAETESLCC